jgi:hypothetical protein
LCLFLACLLSSSLTRSLSYVLSNDSKNAKEKKKKIKSLGLDLQITPAISSKQWRGRFYSVCKREKERGREERHKQEQSARARNQLSARAQTHTIHCVDWRRRTGRRTDRRTAQVIDGLSQLSLSLSPSDRRTAQVVDGLSELSLSLSDRRTAQVVDGLSEVSVSVSNGVKLATFFYCRNFAKKWN